MSVKREDLIKAAKELNDVLGLDPQIKTGKKVTEKELSEQILEAAELILPEDDISEETMRVIKLLKDESVEEEDEEEVDMESEPEEDEEEVDTESEPEEDTEVEEPEEDEDSETEEEEVEDEVDEPEKIKSETKKAKKVEKEQKVKKDMKSNKQRKENASENGRSKSNKAIVYEAWKSNITDIKELAARVNNKVKESTIRTWIAHWKKGKNLPAIARKKDDK
jgi:hypothetical protein